MFKKVHSQKGIKVIGMEQLAQPIGRGTQNLPAAGMGAVDGTGKTKGTAATGKTLSLGLWGKEAAA